MFRGDKTTHTFLLTLCLSKQTSETLKISQINRNKKQQARTGPLTRAAK